MNLSEIKDQVEDEGLRYVTDEDPGWFRQKVRGNFWYYNTRGERIKDEEKLNRIASLVIPPAWDKVWISPKKNGHIQATGIDERVKLSGELEGIMGSAFPTIKQLSLSDGIDDEERPF